MSPTWPQEELRQFTAHIRDQAVLLTRENIPRNEQLDICARIEFLCDALEGDEAGVAGLHEHRINVPRRTPGPGNGLWAKFTAAGDQVEAAFRPDDPNDEGRIDLALALEGLDAALDELEVKPSDSAQRSLRRFLEPLWAVLKGVHVELVFAAAEIRAGGHDKVAARLEELVGQWKER